MNDRAQHLIHETIGVDVTAIYPSPTNPRKHFDPAKHAELSENVRLHGVLQPLLLRKWSRSEPPAGVQIADASALYEIVAGERRWRAAKAAGLEQVPAMVRDLTDQQVLEIQVIENMQREDLHPLEEAEGYEHLMKDHGYTAEDLGAKIGKSKAYIYARLKLTALCQKARDAFYDGKLNPSTALLIARIPNENLQVKACKEITDNSYRSEPLSFREAQDHVQNRYMLRLAEAPFPRADADLVPGAGKCADCPKRSGSQPELFTDVKSADVCTDPDCFNAKRKAWADRKIAQAKEDGRQVIEGAAAKKAMPHNYAGAMQGYVPLDEKCYDAPRNKKGLAPTYRQLLGADAPVAVLRNPHTGEAVEVVSKSAIKTALEEKGIANASPMDDEQKRREQKAKQETAFRTAVMRALHTRAAEGLTLTDGAISVEEVRLVALALFGRTDHDSCKRLVKLRAPEKQKINEREAIEELRKAIGTMTLPELSLLLIELAVISDAYYGPYSTDAAERLLTLAKIYSVDTAQIKRELSAQARAKTAAKKPKTAEKAKSKRTTKTRVPAPSAAPGEPLPATEAAQAQEQPAPEAGEAAPAKGKRKPRRTASPGKDEDRAQAAPAEEGEPTAPANGNGDDQLYEAAKEVVIKLGRPSISLVQKHMQIGYNRAARMIERMEQDGLVSAIDKDGNRTLIQADKVTVTLKPENEWPFPVGNRP